MVVGGLLCHFGGLLCLEAALYISLIDFEKFRCHCLHAEAMSDFLSSITSGVSAFGRFWSGGSSLFRIWNGPTTTGGEDMFQPTEKPAIDLHTQDYGSAPDIGISLRHPAEACADIICGDSRYLRTTFHLQFLNFFIPSVLQKLLSR